MQDHSIEDLIAKICNYRQQDLQNLSVKDKALLCSIDSQLNRNLALTFNQAELVLKILKENKSIINLSDVEQDLIDFPIFKFNFRIIDTTKKIYISNNSIIIKHPYDKKMYSFISSEIKSSVRFDKEQKVHYLKLSIDNIFNLLSNEEIQNYGFEIDSVLLKYYNSIKEIKNKSEDFLPMVDYNGTLFLRNCNRNLEDYFEKNKTGSLFTDTFIAQNLDLTLSYNLIKNLKVDEKFINILLSKKEKFKTSDTPINEKIITEFIKEVNYWPILISLGDNEHSHNELDMWIKNLQKIGIKNQDISVMFRSQDNKKFNEYIKNNSLNNLVSDSTKVVFIKNKMPKILYKINFNPKMIIMSPDLNLHISLRTLVETHPFTLLYTKKLSKEDRI